MYRTIDRHLCRRILTPLVDGTALFSPLGRPICPFSSSEFISFSFFFPTLPVYFSLNDILVKNSECLSLTTTLFWQDRLAKLEALLTKKGMVKLLQELSSIGIPFDAQTTNNVRRDWRWMHKHGNIVHHTGFPVKARSCTGWINKWKRQGCCIAQIASWPWCYISTTSLRIGLQAAKEIQKLTAENRKLQYRITHLIRAAKDADAKLTT